MLRHSLTTTLIHRWNAIQTHAAVLAFAASLLDCHHIESNTSSISEIFAEAPNPSTSTGPLPPPKETCLGEILCVVLPNPEACPSVAFRE